jgi:hypothetical protein
MIKVGDFSLREFSPRDLDERNIEEQMTPTRRHLYRKSRPITPEARFDAIPPESALFANVLAWLKRSQREKARVLVMVKTSAMARKCHVSRNPNTEIKIF